MQEHCVNAELLKEARQVEQAATPPEPAGAHSQRVQALKAAVREAQDNVASMTRDARYALEPAVRAHMPARGVVLTRPVLTWPLMCTFLQEQHQNTDGRQRAAEARSTAVIEEAQAADPQLRCDLATTDAV